MNKYSIWLPCARRESFNWGANGYFQDENDKFFCFSRDHSIYVWKWLHEKYILVTRLSSVLNEPGHQKMCLMSYANNKGADQPAHSRSLISAFVVRCLDSIISLDSIAETSRLASFCGCADQFVSGLAA